MKNWSTSCSSCRSSRIPREISTKSLSGRGAASSAHATCLPLSARCSDLSGPLSPSGSVAAFARISSASVSLLKLATTIRRVASGSECRFRRSPVGLFGDSVEPDPSDDTVLVDGGSNSGDSLLSAWLEWLKSYPDVRDDRGGGANGCVRSLTWLGTRGWPWYALSGSANDDDGVSRRPPWTGYTSGFASSSFSVFLRRFCGKCQLAAPASCCS